MENKIKWKTWGICLALILATYALVPTLFDLPAKIEKLTEAGESIPWHFSIFPEKGLHLWLDLRGGIYAELEIALDESIASRINLAAGDLFKDLKKKNVIPKNWHYDSSADQLKATFLSVENAQVFIDEAINLRNLVNGDAVYLFSKIKNDDPKEIWLKPTDDYKSGLREEISKQATQAVRNRIDRYGLSEPNVHRLGTQRIVIELPGVKDPDRALKVVQQAGQLEFKLVSTQANAQQITEWLAKAKEEGVVLNNYDAAELRKLNEHLKTKLPEGAELAFELKRDPKTRAILSTTPYLLDGKVYLTGDMLENAQVGFSNNEPLVSISFNAEGAKAFGDLTKEHVSEQLAILLDGNVQSAPSIREPILGGHAQIELGFGDRTQLLSEAQDLSLVLQEGALPARLEVMTKTIIGPSLGAESIEKSLKAMLIAGIAIIVFMIFYYRASGILANTAVILNTFFIFAILSMFQATLTLPGMAGIILTIGMAVDANILIFERIRDELASGKGPRDAVTTGYNNGLRAIMDSNLTTIIAGIILYQFGTGPIKGFAVTLIIGLACNLFTAVTMTKTVFDFLIFKQKIKKVSI